MATIDELRTKHGRVAVADTPAGALVFRKPSRQEYKKFQRLNRSEDTHDISDETLAGDIIVSHTREEFMAMLEEFPGLMAGKDINRALSEACGIVKAAEGKG